MPIPGEDRYSLRLNYAFSSEAFEEALSVRPRDVDQPSEVTFCRNVFLPLTTACRYTCSYCTYFDTPGEATLMSEEDLRTQFKKARKAGCREALFTFGDTPDDRYGKIHKTLRGWGYESIIAYLHQACEWALEYNLLPHCNPGDLNICEMKRLSGVNASMGVMLETTADVGAHSGVREKCPAQRLRTLENAGELKVPFTTGILVGIGESWEDRARSLLCFKRLHQVYGHLQEVIVQPVVPNQRSCFETPTVETMRRVVAMARKVLPKSVEVQVPPNLYDVRNVMDCGVGDLGGVSPVTDDYINPDYEWPALRELEEIAEDCGIDLEERGPVYSRYTSQSEWLSETIRGILESRRVIHEEKPLNGRHV